MDNMTARQFKRFKGALLIEVMVAMVVLAIAALGALSYQYHAARQARLAQAQMTATRTAQLLLEDWKSTGGSTDYDPTVLELGFENAASEDEADYLITVDELPMYLTLSHNDVEYDSVAEITLREITVTAQWRRNCEEGPRESDDPSLVLTTYVRVDASGG